MEGFPVRVRVDVRFRDLDPLGHVNNAVFLSYMELARIRYFQRISPDWLEEGHFVVARMEVDYLRPILLGDEVQPADGTPRHRQRGIGRQGAGRPGLAGRGPPRPLARGHPGEDPGPGGAAPLAPGQGPLVPLS